MFDIGMTELLVIGIVALIVVGPKDLPGMFRTLGRFTGKMRGMAREFQRAMEDAADEAGVKDIGRDLKGMSNPKKFGLDKLDEATKGLKTWDKSEAPRKRGPATAAMTKERQAERDRIQEAAADRMERGRTARPEPSEGPVKDTGTAADTALTADESKK